MGDGISKQDENQKKVEKLWSQTFQYSNRIIYQVRNFGFAGVEEMEAPNLDDMLITLQAVSAVIEVLLGGADYEQTRLLLNAKRQITNMEQVASSWKAGNQADFDKAVKALEDQAPF